MSPVNRIVGSVMEMRSPKTCAFHLASVLDTNIDLDRSEIVIPNPLSRIFPSDVVSNYVTFVIYDSLASNCNKVAGVRFKVWGG